MSLRKRRVFFAQEAQAQDVHIVQTFKDLRIIEALGVGGDDQVAVRLRVVVVEDLDGDGDVLPGLRGDGPAQRAGEAVTGVGRLKTRGSGAAEDAGRGGEIHRGAVCQT